MKHHKIILEFDHNILVSSNLLHWQYLCFQTVREFSSFRMKTFIPSLNIHNDPVDIRTLMHTPEIAPSLKKLYWSHRSEHGAISGVYIYKCPYFHCVFGVIVNSQNGNDGLHTEWNKFVSYQMIGSVRNQIGAHRVYRPMKSIGALLSGYSRLLLRDFLSENNEWGIGST